jgi:ABC-type Na+ efflux pump permease subunit
MDSQTGKCLIIIGVAILLIGVVVYFFGGSLKWIGHLPGDIRIEKGNFRFYFPLTTLILLNLLMFLLFRLWKWIN